MKRKSAAGSNARKIRAAGREKTAKTGRTEEEDRMKTNMPVKTAAVFTHEGAPARNISHEEMLRRSVMACLLWEKTFYEDGVEIADRIAELVPKVKPEVVAALAMEAR